VNEVAQLSDIKKLQSMMLNVEQAELETRHHFTDGMYARELAIPAGVCLVGATHKTTHFFTVVRGKCRIATTSGNEEVSAPYMGETVPGTKRVIYAETDCVIMSFHPTTLTDLDEIERLLLEPEDI
jgi:hypothetical protein